MHDGKRIIYQRHCINNSKREENLRTGFQMTGIIPAPISCFPGAGYADDCDYVSLCGLF